MGVKWDREIMIKIQFVMVFVILTASMELSIK